jgi:FKBP-type peptidyl-prolyl cis-trans isomerase
VNGIYLLSIFAVILNRKKIKTKHFNYQIMKFLKPTLALISMAVIISGCNSKKIGKVDLKTKSDSVSYAIGVNMGHNIKNSKIEDLNILAVANGLSDVKEGKKDIMTPEKSIEIIQKYIAGLQKAIGEKNLAEGKKFLEENAKKDGVITDSTGVQYKVLQEGTGPMPKETDVVKVNYKGSLIDGTEFDSSYKRKEPLEIPLNGVIRGWSIGLQKVKVGSKCMIWIPAQLGYGERGGGPIGPNQVLIFEIELLEIVKQQPKK